MKQSLRRLSLNRGIAMSVCACLCLISGLLLIGDAWASPSVVRPTPRRVPIEQIRAGDAVLAYDFESHAIAERQVLATHRSQTHHLVEIGLSGCTIRATRLHRFWCESLHQWTQAADLKSGMSLRLVDGRVVMIQSVKVLELASAVPTYNFEVDEDHDYFVGPLGALVHNGTPLDEPGHWNYYLVDKYGNPYYSGEAGPNETESDVRYRHTKQSQPGGKTPGRFDPANGDRLERVPGTRSYGDARRLEHENAIAKKTYVGRDGPNYRGNRQKPIGPRNADKYYADGEYPECP